MGGLENLPYIYRGVSLVAWRRVETIFEVLMMQEELFSDSGNRSLPGGQKISSQEIANTGFLTLGLTQLAGASVKLTKQTRFCLVLIVTAVLAFYLMAIREGQEWGDDFAMYIHHARNIAEGIDYKQTGYIYNQSIPLIGPNTYPPVFPLLLAPVYKIFGMDLTAMKVEIILAFFLSLLMIYLTFRDGLPWLYLIALIAAIGFNPLLCQFKENIVSDIPFLIFLYFSLFLIDRLYRQSITGIRQIFYVILIGISVYLAYGTRSIGLLLIPCLLGYDIITKRRLSFTTIKITALVAGLVILQSIFLHSDSSYSDQLHPTIGTIKHNLVIYTRALSDFWDNGYSKLLRLALFATVTGLAIVGYLARLKEKITYFEIFIVVYLISIVIIPLDGGARYLIPIFPLYLFYAFTGIKTISRRRLIIEGVIFAAVSLAIIGAYIAQYGKSDFGPIREGITRNETRQLFDYVTKNTNSTDVFVFRKPRAFALFTERSASAWHQPQDDNDLWNYLEKINADYVVVGPRYLEAADQEYIRRFIDKYRDRFQETYTNPDFVVYKIKEKS